MKKLLIPLAIGVALTSHISYAETQKTVSFQTVPSIIQQTNIADYKQEAAQLVANSPEILAYIRQQFSMDVQELLLSELDKGVQDKALMTELSRLDQNMVNHKGLTNHVEQLLQVRLADASMLPALKQGEDVLFAFEPAGDESEWQAIEAYDQAGNIHFLSVDELPTQAVIVVDIDQQISSAAGIRLMQNMLGERQSYPSEATIEASIDVTILDKIRLDDDEEPWVSGNAEIYGVVTGVDPSRDEPHLDIVDMPYLDDDGKNYYPNQVIIHWDRYRYQAADILLMEQDDNTNYQTLLNGLLGIASTALNAYGRPDIGAIVSITNQIIQAFPGSWFTNDDDYVDVYYTLRKGYTYTNRRGASSNANVNMHPSTIQGN